MPHTTQPLSTVALILSSALGDSLLMMTVARNLRLNGVAVTVFGQLPDNATNQAAVPGSYSDTITVTVTY